MKKLLLIGFVALVTIPMQAGAYGVETHAAITKEVASFYNQFYPSHAFTQAEIKTLMSGAIDEDDGLRFLNHFYDPVHKVGLTYLGQHMTSKAWVQDAVAQAGPVNNALALVLSPSDYNSTDYTWKRAIQDYAEGKTERGLQGLGHVLHLVEDLTVPAHVRNDPHPPKDDVGEKMGDDDPYELWSHKFNQFNINILPHMVGKSPVSGLGSLNTYFDAVAKYTNSNFFSKDTIYDGDFLAPEKNKISVISSDARYEYLGQSIEGSKSILAKKRISLFEDIGNKLSTDSDIISQSTWDRLSVKAVQYGAGVVDLFFSEVEKLKKDPNFKPASDKSLFGQLIDSVGENVSALISGAPAPQPVVVAKNTSKPVADEVIVPTISQPTVTTTPPAPISIVVTPQVSPATPASASKNETTLHSSSGSGNDEPAVEIEKEPDITEEVVEPEKSEEELVEEPPVEEVVIPETEEPAAPPVPEIDVSAPVAISDLAVKKSSENAITLTWTAPGDDGLVGTAVTYELRYGASSLTEENWLTATVAIGVSAPQMAGEREQFEVIGLSPMTTYYFAIKARDESENESSISNIIEAKTLIPKSNHLVISEVYPDMVGADVNEIVELYNPTDVPIVLSGYSLQYLPSGATALTGVSKKNFASGATIPAKGFYSIGMSGNPTADMIWSEQLNNTGATIFLINDQVAITSLTDENIVDKVAYGTGPGLLSPEGAPVILPGEGKSLERKALVDGVCVVAIGSAEFLGNGCDTGNNSNDFDIRTTSKAQRLISLIEPRNAPTAVSNVPTVLTFNAPAVQLNFNWLPSIDASGSSAGMTYKILDTNNPAAPVQLYLGSALTFTKTVDEVGREYKASIQAFDRDGMPSSVVDLSVQAPSYLKELSFYRGSPIASGSPSYFLRLAWEAYPFIPVSNAQWHLAVFFYNKDAEKIPFLGQLNSGFNWGLATTFSSTFRTSYANCLGTVTTGASLVFPDNASRCGPFFGNAKGAAIDFGLLRDKMLTLPVLPTTFGSTTPVAGKDYITVAYYYYVEGNPLGLDQALVAVDKTHYYLSE